MSEFDEDGLDRLKREHDQVISLYENGWGLAASRPDLTEEQIKDWIAAVNAELAETSWSRTRSSLESLRKRMALRLVEDREKRRAQVA